MAAKVGPPPTLVRTERAPVRLGAYEAAPDEPVAHAPAVIVHADVAEGLVARRLLVRLARAEERRDDLARDGGVLVLLVGHAEVERVEARPLTDRRQDAHLDAPAAGPGDLRPRAGQDHRRG